MGKCIWAKWDKKTHRLVCIDATAEAGGRCFPCGHYREHKKVKPKRVGINLPKPNNIAL